MKVYVCVRLCVCTNFVAFSAFHKIFIISALLFHFVDKQIMNTHAQKHTPTHKQKQQTSPITKQDISINMNDRKNCQETCK